MTDNKPVSPEGEAAARQLDRAGKVLLKLKGLKHRPHLLDLFVKAITAVEAEYPSATHCKVSTLER
ncbi:hypothetical protein FRZ61_33000 [Hypericibacter adhaerens]|uniref:Uncharacterized protein n=1 Tax=Hypericibacter adhaerens TaxID=2602016 RepID=A0A5J6N047_9PROT|nr:hypothetical protein [Hypericibacter adhaerens]QEX23362.1 hypothetical protein FRZ61_33000 [Hypericibacter adhaerens]